MELESLPLENSCLGCKRYFLRGEKLPLQSMVVEFKNYTFPIKGSFLKFTLLKTIVGFMNSKGGTLYMGVDDASGNVEGVTLGRKQMDQFKLMIKAMLEKVQPAVDLVKSEQVSVEFVPVLEGKDKGFYGKYVVKFIVLQGDPSKLYCISEKVKTTGVKPEDVEVISAFRRHTLGGLQEVKGIRVIHQIYQKARNPHNVAKTFHENCNPQPIYPILLEILKTEKIPQIFADEDSQQDANKVSPNRIQSESQSQSFSNSSASEPETIIDLIKDEIEMEKQNTKLPQSTNVIFFQNVRPDAYKSCINFMKNSTHAKYSKQISEQRGFIKVVFNTSADKGSMLENMEKPTLKKLLNDFGINGKVNILQNLTFKPQIKKQNSNKNKSQQNQFNYAILFYKYKQQDEESIKNYLQKSIAGSITRKLKKKKSGQEGLEMTFKKQSQLNVFMSLCSNPPHSTQLRNFWGKEGVKMKKYTKTNVDAQVNAKEVKKESNNTYIAKNLSQQHNLVQIQTKIQAEPIYQKENKFNDVLQLVASNLEPSEVPKLTNYMVNSMFYNIQKKILGSKERYYIRIVFNQAKDCQRFGEICLIEQHKKILAQFSGTKSLRIGIPGDNLLIYPYSDNYKDQIRKIVTSSLGQGAIRKSVIKELGNDQKVWSLALNDSSKLFEYYQKLESYFRKQGIFLNQEWVRFKVYLNYKYLIE